MRQIVLDTETTGLSTAQGHRIIEIGCVELINRRLSGRNYHRFLNPDREIDEGAERVHGISLADLANLNSAGSFFPVGLDPAVSVSGITFVPEQAIDVPEPWPLALLSFGLIGFAVMRCRRLVPIRMRSTAIA